MFGEDLHSVGASCKAKRLCIWHYTSIFPCRCQDSATWNRPWLFPLQSLPDPYKKSSSHLSPCLLPPAVRVQKPETSALNILLHKQTPQPGAGIAQSLQKLAYGMNVRRPDWVSILCRGRQLSLLNCIQIWHENYPDSCLIGMGGGCQR